MQLSMQQKQAIENGEAVRIDAEGIDCVLLRRDVYDQVRQRLGCDDGSLTAKERQFLLQQAAERAGWNDPEMSVYDDLDPRK